MVSVALEFVRYGCFEFLLHLERRLAGREPRAVADAKNVGVHRDGGLTECHVEHDICGFAADTGKRFERLARARHLAAVFGDKPFRQRNHVLGLVAEEANGLDQVAHARLTQLDHLLRCVCERKQRGRRLVHACIGSLG